MKDKTMYIKTVYDLIQYSKEHPNYEYTVYDGEWIVYDDKNNLISSKDIQFNGKLMYSLAESGLLTYQGCVISHRAVRQYTLDADFEEKVQKMKYILSFVINKLQNYKVSSIAKLQEYFKDDYYITYSRDTLPGSYWGGGFDTSVLYIYDNPNKFNKKLVFKCVYYMMFNIKGKKLHKMLLQEYSKIFLGFDEWARNYRNYVTEHSYTIDQKYYDLENESLKKAQEECLKNVLDN